MKHPFLLLIAAGALCVLAVLLTAVPGFRFSILLCILGALLLVGIFFLVRSPAPAARRILKVLLILVILGAIAAAVTAGFILKAAHPAQPPACRYLVVLGAGVRGSVPSLTLRERINAAYDYLSANPEAIAVLSGGQGPGEDITEAACMYRELTAMGIDGSRLLLEERSTSTMENLTYSLDILEDTLGFRPRTLGIVSSEYHIFRASLFARELELEPVGIPARTSWLSLRINYYLREIVAVWKYLILGP